MIQTDEMRNIKAHILEKYLDTDAYRAVEHGIYKSLRDGMYCLCLEADDIPAYPLRSAMEQFSLEFAPDGMPSADAGSGRQITELQTRDDSTESFVKIVHMASAIGKTIVNFRMNSYDILCVVLGTADITVNGQRIAVPLLGARCSFPWHHLDFCARYPEAGLRIKFSNGNPLTLPQITEKCKIRAVVCRRYFAYLVYKEKHVNKAIVFNDQMKALWQCEDICLDDALLRGEIYEPQSIS